MSDRLLGTNYNTAALNSLRQSSSDEDNAESSEVSSSLYCSQVTQAEAEVCKGILTGLWALNKKKRILR